jgi:hypothetical protein
MDDPLSDPRIRLPVSATLNFKTIPYFTKSCSLCDEPVHVIHTVFLPAAGTEISTSHCTSFVSKYCHKICHVYQCEETD